MYYKVDAWMRDESEINRLPSIPNLESLAIGAIFLSLPMTYIRITCVEKIILRELIIAPNMGMNNRKEK